MDDHCWAYPCPRRQWSRKACPGFENETLYLEFKAWMDKPRVVTRRQLRREMSRSAARNRRLTFRCRRGPA